MKCLLFKWNLKCRVIHYANMLTLGVSYAKINSLKVDLFVNISEEALQNTVAITVSVFSICSIEELRSLSMWQLYIYVHIAYLYVYFSMIGFPLAQKMEQLCVNVCEARSACSEAHWLTDSSVLMDLKSCLIGWRELMVFPLSQWVDSAKQPELLSLSLPLSLSDIWMQFIFIPNVVHFFRKRCFNCALQPALCLSESRRKCHRPLATCQVTMIEALWVD